jgi:UDP-N-acetylglucosamine kinase
MNYALPFPAITFFTLTDEEKSLEEKACAWVKASEKDIIKKFADPAKYTQVSEPISLFMAGSPGAGKTEMSKTLIQEFKGNIIHIDADEIRKMIPGYTGGNSYVFQRAATIGVNKLHDYALKTKKHFILDTTLSTYEKAYSNIKRSLDKNRRVIVQYLYLEPASAWDYTKMREAIELRHIPKEVFVDHFINARTVVNKLKEDFGQKINLDFIEKDYTNKVVNVALNTSSVDPYLRKRYTHDELTATLI